MILFSIIVLVYLVHSIWFLWWARKVMNAAEMRRKKLVLGQEELREVVIDSDGCELRRRG